MKTAAQNAQYLGKLVRRWFLNPLKQLWLHTFVCLLRTVRSSVVTEFIFF